MRKKAIRPFVSIASRPWWLRWLLLPMKRWYSGGYFFIEP